MTTTYDQARYSTTPFTDNTSGWAAYAASGTGARILVGNNSYSCASPLGLVAGIVGNWEMDGSASYNGTQSYSKMLFSFGNDGSFKGDYYTSSTSSFSGTPSTTVSGTYSANADGTYSINTDLLGTLLGTHVTASKVAILGGYLVFPELALTKQ